MRLGAIRFWMLLAVVLATLPFPLRVPRWRLLLRQDDGGPVGWPADVARVAIGFAANNVLPLRAGEVVRMMAVSRLGRCRSPPPSRASPSSACSMRCGDGSALARAHARRHRLPADLRIGDNTPIRTLAIAHSE